MSFTHTFAAAVCAALLTTAAAAEIRVADPYLRSSGPSAPTGAAFMVIENTGAQDDRLIAVRSDLARRIELHTHVEDANGVMRMIEIDGGILVPAGGSAMLARGGDHVMFLGLTRSLEQGDSATVTMVFEQAGELVLTIPVDLDRKPMQGNGHGQMTSD